MRMGQYVKNRTKPSNYQLLSVFLIVVFISAASSQQVENIISFASCITPNNEHGSCIYLEQCTHLYNLLKKKPIPSEDRILLQHSQCGINSGKVLICCPKRKIGTRISNQMETRLGVEIPEPGVCGNVVSNRVYGGNFTKIDEFPWMALIELKTKYDLLLHYCGGSLINSRYILTAAHCVTDLPEGWVVNRVRLGEWDKSTDVDCDIDVKGNKDCSDPHIDVEVEKVISHEKYKVLANTKNTFDIALIRLARSVNYTFFIRPICLPLKDHLKNSTFEGVVMDISGWGKTEEGTSSSIKRKAEVPIVALNECQEVYRQRRVELTSSQICAGGMKGVDSCLGDSGGPLIGLDSSNKSLAYNFIAGVLSFGADECGIKGWPGVFVRVSEQIDWILRNLEP